MKSVLCMEFKRAFKSKAFLLMVLAGCVVAGLAFYNTRPYGLAHMWWTYLSGGNSSLYDKEMFNPMDTALQIWMPNRGYANKYFYSLVMFMPIMAAVPYGASFLADIRTGLINQIAVRSKKSHYYTAKLIVAFVSGGTVAVIPYIFNLILCMCYLPWGTPLYSTGLYPVSSLSVLSELYYTHPELYVLIYLLRTFVLYGLINCLCLTMVYVEDNRFAVILTPFILYYSSVIIFRFVTGDGSKALLSNANMIYFFRTDVVAVSIQMVILLAAAAAFLIRIKKDVVH